VTENAPLADASPALRRAVAVAVPDRTVEGVEWPTGSDRPGNEVVALTLADGEPARAYLKVATGDGGPERVAREAALLRYVGANAAVRAPTVLAADPDADPPYLLTRPLAGQRLVDRLDADEGGDVDPDDLARVLTRIGQATAGLHAAGLDRAGAVRGGDASGLDLAERPWSTLLREQVVEPHGVSDRFAGLPERAGDLLRERSTALELDEGAATVVHDDLHAQNVFDAGGERTDASRNGAPEPDLGVIDFESGLVGDPGFDLARTEDLAIDGRPELTDAEREEARAALRVGYRTAAAAHGLSVPPAGLPPGFEAHRDTYRVVTFLLTAVSFERWAPAAPAPVDELAAWVHEEFDRRLAVARGEEP
jgi:aminoglycoside phosphotransferase (APT) family kinase protein